MTEDKIAGEVKSSEVVLSDKAFYTRKEIEQIITARLAIQKEEYESELAEKTADYTELNTRYKELIKAKQNAVSEITRITSELAKIKGHIDGVSVEWFNEITRDIKDMIAEQHDGQTEIEWIYKEIHAKIRGDK
jgi:chromosome segregation ATPase